jgi:hypothetical protein
MAAPKTIKAKTAGREPVREPQSRVPDDRDVIRNRAGQPVSLRIRGDEDQFAFDRSIVPPGWDYQWKAQSVYGAPLTQHMVNMAQNGWEPVPADRHDGLFMEKGFKGNITRGGMILMERDARLTAQSKAMDKRAADEAVGAAFKRVGQGIPKTITDFNHPDAQKNTYVNREREGFATQSEESYSYEAND